MPNRRALPALSTNQTSQSSSEPMRVERRSRATRSVISPSANDHAGSNDHRAHNRSDNRTPYGDSAARSDTTRAIHTARANDGTCFYRAHGNKASREQERQNQLLHDRSPWVAARRYNSDVTPFATDLKVDAPASRTARRPDYPDAACPIDRRENLALAKFPPCASMAPKGKTEPSD
jgi:hypothetical protein